MEKNQAIEVISKHIDHCVESGSLVEQALIMAIGTLAQPEYEPVAAEDLAKTMSENTLYSFIAWYGKVLDLMEKYGFVICKKTIPLKSQEGEWIIEKDEHGVTRGRCPKCGMVQYAGYTNFCPDCGTKLKGGAG